MLQFDAPKTPEEFKVEPKTYYHMHNYARFIFADPEGAARPVQFGNHKYITDDKREQRQLDLVADRPGTMIYTIAETVKNELAERQHQLTEQVEGAAAATFADRNLRNDPSQPVVPINNAVVGAASSISNVTPVQPVTVQMNQPPITNPPTPASVAAEALANLNKTAGKT
jgi:hypothetical protein